MNSNQILIEKDVSERIKIARVICILAVIYVHIPPNTNIMTNNIFSFEFFIQEIRYFIGRTSVPLLSIVSGYLMVTLLARKNWTQQMRGKFKTLILPLVLWSLIKFVLTVANSGLPQDADALYYLNSFLALTRYPASSQLYFLRDIFVCGLFFPVILFMLRANVWITLLILTSNSIANFDSVLFINSQIPLFFAAGCAFALPQTPLSIRAIDNNMGTLFPIAFLALFPLLIAFAIVDPGWWRSQNGSLMLNFLVLVSRIGGSLCFWYLSLVIYRKALAPYVLRYEPVIFFVFCSHLVLMGLVWEVLRQLGSEIGDPVYMIFFITAPLTSLATGIVSVYVLRKISPKLLELLMGGRIPDDKQMRRMLGNPLLADSPARNM
ncbi:acyltransferase [Rhizobiaceae bacterium BDR2-2]|uniref:Acyltransferase n=1 Tax=Ectorhizobium quercum TaxID=2965071 RepID=A0AAE3SWC8_9HYPH|nr:acyltransferase [Ectorhizobium quercum]MCX8999037.1 acyltransferase [Ectorhizobium quercum]